MRVVWPSVRKDLIAMEKNVSESDLDYVLAP